MSCLLGIIDSEVTSKHTTSWNINKIGGKPDWYGNKHPSEVCCKLCGRNQVLVVQLYCPLEGSAYHRTLYIFACTSQTCWNKSESWVVYRCQEIDAGLTTTVEERPQTNRTESVQKQDDWGTEDDDWGESADEWGDDSQVDSKVDHLVADIKHGARGTYQKDVMKHEESSRWNNEETIWEDDRVTVDDSLVEDLHLQSNKQNTEVSELNLQAMCIDDIDDEADNVKTPECSSNILAEELNVKHLGVEDRIKALQQLQASHGDDTSADQVQISPYFVNVFEEPLEEEEDIRHVAKLLKEYQTKDGCNIKDLVDEYSASGGSVGEKYEKTHPAHMDPEFKKFMKKLSSCPEQAIRYQWSGEPLYMSSPGDWSPARCAHCGVGAVSELQLTPALVNKLRFSDLAGPAVEFGTVFVFTCRASCWDSSSVYRTEQALVQADPDQHLFSR